MAAGTSSTRTMVASTISATIMHTPSNLMNVIPDAENAPIVARQTTSAIHEIDPGLREQLARYRDAPGADLPLGAALIFLRCWVRLYGRVSLEVFGHLHFALDDAAPMFELTLRELAELVNLEYPLPQS
jgi:hypothetical protein